MNLSQTTKHFGSMMTMAMVVLFTFNIVCFETAFSQQNFNLSHVFDIGGVEQTTEEYMFRGPERAVLDSKHNLYVVDERAAEIKMFNPSGEYVKKHLGDVGGGQVNFWILAPLILFLVILLWFLMKSIKDFRHLISMAL